MTPAFTSGTLSAIRSDMVTISIVVLVALLTAEWFWLKSLERLADAAVLRMLGGGR